MEQCAEIYMERHAKAKKKSWRNDRAILNADILPVWRHRLRKDITRRDVRELLNAIVDRGAPIHANRVRACWSKLFKFVITEDGVEVNPVADVPHWSRRVEAIVTNAPGSRVLPFAKFAYADRM
jgi:hypothetical protein